MEPTDASPTKPVSLHRLDAQTHNTLLLLRADLGQLGVDLDRFSDMFYMRTQKIGATAAFLGHDGLIAPSARWSCDNLMVFYDNHDLPTKLDVVGSETLNWLAWASAAGFVSSQ